MTVFSPTPIRGHAERLQTYHAWSVARRQFECYHYELDNGEAEALIARGKVKELTVPFACYYEAQRRGEYNGKLIDLEG